MQENSAEAPEKSNFPIIATIIVIAAVMTMIGMGIWQLQRLDEKKALIALYDANAQKSAIAYPPLGPVQNENMFRRSSANCLSVIGWQTGSGKDAGGKAGVRHIAECSTGAEGPGVIILLGIDERPRDNPNWKGGVVSGFITTEPDKSNILQKAFGGKKILRPMLVSDSPQAGLRAPARPQSGDVPNDHLLYAIQWFFFAFAASVIYILALRKKLKG
ncbi:hypothetical protein LPB140_03865 [Sphingorhabdus lutea]|uniref:SURF1-like protein n=1 Tax=Sphingorhabdus lutea TaxID=1913578 RepID=A0A1L3JAE4_9SPHN|nr:SURF1 family protein [Sphingorhabdus lutea]APG62089.1 hypothetical protein LPB140_03865 [Sphingorhabdus lutea]